MSKKTKRSEFFPPPYVGLALATVTHRSRAHQRLQSRRTSVTTPTPQSSSTDAHLRRACDIETTLNLRGGRTGGRTNLDSDLVECENVVGRNSGRRHLVDRIKGNSSVRSPDLRPGSTLVWLKY